MPVADAPPTMSRNCGKDRTAGTDEADFDVVLLSPPSSRFRRASKLFSSCSALSNAPVCWPPSSSWRSPPAPTCSRAPALRPYYSDPSNHSRARLRRSNNFKKTESCVAKKAGFCCIRTFMVVLCEPGDVVPGLFDWFDDLCGCLFWPSASSATAWPGRTIGDGFGVQAKPERTGPADLRRIKAFGFSYVRYDMGWGGGTSSILEGTMIGWRSTGLSAIFVSSI